MSRFQLFHHIHMKRSLILLTATATAFVFGACNKHSWDEEVDAHPPTKVVFQPHGDHGGHDKDGDHDGKKHDKTDPSKDAEKADKH